MACFFIVDAICLDSIILSAKSCDIRATFSLKDRDNSERHAFEKGML